MCTAGEHALHSHYVRRSTRLDCQADRPTSDDGVCLRSSTCQQALGLQLAAKPQHMLLPVLLATVTVSRICFCRCVCVCITPLPFLLTQLPCRTLGPVAGRPKNLLCVPAGAKTLAPSPACSGEAAVAGRHVNVAAGCGDAGQCR